jgi:flagellar motor switch/type III secretory pathway protein FliN
MAAMNRSDTADLDPKPGAELNLDDDSLFAELDSEVMASDESGGGDLDFDFDLGGDATAADSGGGLEAEGSGSGGGAMDLDLGGDASSQAGSINLDDLELDVEESKPAEPAAGELDLGGEGRAAADFGDIDLELEGATPAAGGEAADELLDLEIDGEEAPASAGEAIDLDTLELGDESAEPLGEDMEALDLDLEGGGLESLDLGAVDSGLVDLEPEPAVESTLEPAGADLGLEELSVQPIELPEEPVFDLGAAPAGVPAAEAGAPGEFHAAEDIQLDEEPLHLELDEVAMESAGEIPGAETVETFELTEEAPVPLEPDMLAEPAIEFETAAATDIGAQSAREFVAVRDVQVDDDTLLELNLDDVEAGQITQEDEPVMAHQEPQAAAAMEETIPLTEQLEIPPEVGARAGRARIASLPREGIARAQPAMPERMLNSEILMAVSHQIAVQLGSLSLNGKELLEIGYGSVLPLDRAIGEPVDLVLDNKTIAQGEVVLINGKTLGVRIVALNKH